ncbi:MAG: hypothetical protein KF805_06515 [Phycisphaeraceae bacterium]|nr:hypothetical protein [Phycisphaeraceae bacterium]
MSVQQPGSGGLLFKLGLVVLSIGLCALSMLVMRQARLQAAHEVTQTQLRIQRADEKLWKMRADIAGLSNPVRIRQLAGNLGPMHALINPVELSASPSMNLSIPMVEKFQPLRTPAHADVKSTKGPGAKTGDAGEARAKSADKSKEKAAGASLPKSPIKPPAKPEPKSQPHPAKVSPTGLAAVPAPKVRDLDR